MDQQNVSPLEEAAKAKLAELQASGESALDVISKPTDKIEDHMFATTDEVKGLDIVNDISEFSTGIANWHMHNMNQLQHALNTPEYDPEADAFIRITISSNDESRGAVDGQRILHPKELEAFKAGIRYALDQCYELPFKFIPTDADGNISPEFQGEHKLDEETKQDN